MSATKKQKKRPSRAAYLRTWRANKRAEADKKEAELRSAKNVGAKVDMIPGEVAGKIASIVEEAVERAMEPMKNQLDRMEKLLTPKKS